MIRLAALSKRLRWLQLVVTVVCVTMLAGLAACGVSSGGRTGPRGTISGDVVAGPTCPVERITNPCPPAPVQNRQLSILTQSGTVVATTTTDDLGRFRVEVPPGSYVVRVQIVPGRVGLRQITPGDIAVRAGATSVIHILLDTGIR
jgi:Carboxypeptidase regulatory-like domain